MVDTLCGNKSSISVWSPSYAAFNWSDTQGPVGGLKELFAPDLFHDQELERPNEVTGDAGFLQRFA